MIRQRRRWRVVTRDVHTNPAAFVIGAHRDSIVVLCGLVAGLLTALVASELPSNMAPMAMIVVLVSTLFAGRVAPIRPALGHGACAWMTIVVVAGLTHRLSRSWHGLSALWVSLVLIEDMALIGRVGYVRQLIKRERIRDRT